MQKDKKGEISRYITLTGRVEVRKLVELLKKLEEAGWRPQTRAQILTFLVEMMAKDFGIESLGDTQLYGQKDGLVAAWDYLDTMFPAMGVNQYQARQRREQTDSVMSDVSRFRKSAPFVRTFTGKTAKREWSVLEFKEIDQLREYIKREPDQSLVSKALAQLQQDYGVGGAPNSYELEQRAKVFGQVQDLDGPSRDSIPDLSVEAFRQHNR